MLPLQTALKVHARIRRRGHLHNERTKLHDLDNNPSETPPAWSRDSLGRLSCWACGRAKRRVSIHPARMQISRCDRVTLKCTGGPPVCTPCAERNLRCIEVADRRTKALSIKRQIRATMSSGSKRRATKGKKVRIDHALLSYPHTKTCLLPRPSSRRHPVTLQTVTRPRVQDTLTIPIDSPTTCITRRASISQESRTTSLTSLDRLVTRLPFPHPTSSLNS